jgi:hypothetical protein
MEECITAKLAGLLHGPKANAVIRALEAMGRERWRSLPGGFSHEVMMHTSMLASDVNPVICDLLASGLLHRRGEQILVVTEITVARAVALCPATKEFLSCLSGRT